MKRMFDHFENISTAYNELRTTDLEPILYIREKMHNKNHVRGADIGCGGGRYDLLLLQQVPGLYLICGDVNVAMVEETSRFLEEQGQKNFGTCVIDASNLNLSENTLDFVTTFNAIHHFDPVMFLNQAAKSLQKGGYVFVYTRLKSQNARNIWGRFFPGFKEKEKRLYDLSRVEEWIDRLDFLVHEVIRFFRFKRTASLTHLLSQAEGRHYSTFSLYSEDEFSEAVDIFRRQIENHFVNPERIAWYDENVMIVFRKDAV
jgi:SAM-dependent methyltransferase